MRRFWCPVCRQTLIAVYGIVQHTHNGEVCPGKLVLKSKED